MQSSVDLIKDRIEFALGYLADENDKSTGGFYLLGSLPAIIRWEGEDTDSEITLLGRVKLTSVKNGRLKDVIGKKGKIEAIANHVDDALIIQLLEGFDKQLSNLVIKRKLYGRPFTTIDI